MDAAIPVDAKIAPTGIWKTAQNACASSEGWRVQWETDPPR
jgi:hypothetical protein